MSKKNDNPKRQAKGDHEVGYCRPPQESRFKAGETGNPKGGKLHKKRKAPTEPEHRQEFWKLMNSDVAVKFNGRETKMKAITALMHQALAKALGGDFRSLKLLMDKFDGNMKIEDVMREAKNALPSKITVEFVESDGKGGLKQCDPTLSDQKDAETPLDGDSDENEDWLK